MLIILMNQEPLLGYFHSIICKQVTVDFLRGGIKRSLLIFEFFFIKNAKENVCCIMYLREMIRRYLCLGNA